MFCRHWDYFNKIEMGAVELRREQAQEHKCLKFLQGFRALQYIEIYKGIKGTDNQNKRVKQGGVD